MFALEIKRRIECGEYDDIYRYTRQFQTKSLTDVVGDVGLDGDWKLEGHIVHVIKKSLKKSSPTKIGANKGKPATAFYDRLIYIRDVTTGRPFVVSCDLEESVVALFWPGEKFIGSRVAIVDPKPDGMMYKVPKFRISDSLVIAENQNTLIGVQAIPLGTIQLGGFMPFVHVGPLSLRQMMVVNLCSAVQCDGLHCKDKESRCWALKSSPSHRQKTGLAAMVDSGSWKAEITSISFMQLFVKRTHFNTNVSNFNLVDFRSAVRAMLTLPGARFEVLGWTQPTPRVDGEVASTNNFHVAYVKTDENFHIPESLKYPVDAVVAPAAVPNVVAADPPADDN